MVWEIKRVPLVPKDENGLPATALHLIVARNVRDILDVKVLRQQRAAGNIGEGTLARGLFALASGALLRGPKDRTGLRSLRGAIIPRTDASIKPSPP